MWPPSRMGIGQQVQQPKVQADLSHQREKRDHTELRRLAGQLRHGDRSHQLLRRGFARDESPNRLENHAGVFDVALDAHPDCPDEARLDADRLVGDVDAEKAAAVAFAGCRQHRHRRAVAQNRHRDLLIGMLDDGAFQIAREGDRLAVDGQDDVVGLEPGTFSRFAGADQADMRMDIGLETDVADLEPTLLRRWLRSNGVGSAGRRLVRSESTALCSDACRPRGRNPPRSSRRDR